METKNRLRDYNKQILFSLQGALHIRQDQLKNFAQQANILPRRLLQLSVRAQIAIVFLCFLIGIFFYMYWFPNSTNGNILALPTALAVWLFKYRGALISILWTLVILITSLIYLELTNYPLKGISTIIIIVVFSRCAEIILILYLRNSIEIADKAQEQAVEARQQMKQALEEQQQAYEQQLHLNQMKDQFLLNVNHELRTPLTELYGYLELLQLYNHQIDNELRTTFLNRAVQGCEELQRLITHIMDAIQAGTQIQPPVIEEVNVLKAVQKLLEQLAPQKHEDYEIRLNIPENQMVWADPLYLQQVLRNLLSNAFKYSPLRSDILISANLYKKDGEEGERSSKICISVKDTGPGIPPRELPLLFGKFVRLQRDISGTVRGTGLGLYICREMIGTMDGEIWAESMGIAGEGSRFCFTLPMVEEQMVEG